MRGMDAIPEGQQSTQLSSQALEAQAGEPARLGYKK